MKLRLLLTFVLFLFPAALMAQGDDDFCEAVSVILRDAPNQFRNVRTNITQTSVGAATYKSGINVPGTLNSRFVSSMGVFYEGALCQSTDISVIKTAYEKYKIKLNDCLAGKGFKMSLLENLTPGLADYKKVSYLPAFDKDTDLRTLKGHVTMEVDYRKETGLYTLIFYIYRH